MTTRIGLSFPLIVCKEDPAAWALSDRNVRSRKTGTVQLRAAPKSDVLKNCLRVTTSISASMRLGYLIIGRGHHKHEQIPNCVIVEGPLFLTNELSKGLR